MDGDGDEKKPESLRSARVRFGDPQAAAKCAAELKEYEGAPVTAAVIEGEEEKEFWERLWAAADKGGKGKGKGKKGKDKGKDKGKGKGKGKKGKGKGKK